MRKTLLLAAALSAGWPALAAAEVTVHIERMPGRQALLAPDAHVEDFAGASGIGFTSRFGGSDASASFAGFTATGGAATIAPGQASIRLDRGATYFGYRPARLDENNTVELLARGTSLGSFNFADSPAKTGIVGASLAWGISNMMAGIDGAATSPFTYVNFFTEIAFDEIRFTQTEGVLTLDDVRVGGLEELAQRSMTFSRSRVVEEDVGPIGQVQLAALSDMAKVSAIPEPSGWALMIAGFGTVGFALRRRRRVKGVRFA